MLPGVNECGMLSQTSGKTLHSQCSGAFGMQHLNKQVVAGHVPIQVLVVEVLLGLQTDSTDFWQP